VCVSLSINQSGVWCVQYGVNRNQKEWDVCVLAKQNQEVCCVCEFDFSLGQNCTKGVCVSVMVCLLECPVNGC
jgi:hypothetical protein